mmetsp:Transcript_521/g.1858  ORF Transcript_521/g.1858 Transcript_521/m.1858 type:complete len:780 (+) Transcript_521:660-2999(+)
MDEAGTAHWTICSHRMENNVGYIKGLSEDPQRLSGGFHKMEKVMKWLFLRSVSLWPRFRSEVNDELEGKAPEVVELHQSLSPSMAAIQLALVEAMDLLLKELRKTNKIDLSDLTVENNLFKSFDEAIQRQLDPIWHTVGRKVKRLVADLKTLRKLTQHLLQYDAVTFHMYLETLRASEGVGSTWLYLEPSHRIFENSKRRVYTLVRSDGKVLVQPRKGTNSKKKPFKEREEEHKAQVEKAELLPTLEPLPKWSLIYEVLNEILIDGRKLDVPAQTNSDMDRTSADENADPIRVLIVTGDQRTCGQLQEVTRRGLESFMQEKFSSYLKERNSLQKHRRRQRKYGADKDLGTAAGATEGDEQEALKAAAKTLQQKKRAAKRSQGVSRTSALDKKRRVQEGENVELAQGDLEGAADEDRVLYADGRLELRTSFFESEPWILDDFAPDYVLIYDADLAFVRELEVYKASHPRAAARIYFLMYEASVESQKYLSTVNREKQAFESLIMQRKHLAPTAVAMGPALADRDTTLEVGGAHMTNSATRKGGGRNSLVAPRKQVVIDMREFNSSLPCVLHQKGMDIHPVTLGVGDYILSPEICVERKSISDLYGSFASGRLYHQAATMSKHYKLPVLLIEFSRDKAFSFQNEHDIGDDISVNNIVSKLVLLTLHFPKLRLVWSRGVHMTVEIFKKLKENQEEPTVQRAVEVGGEEWEDREVTNVTAVDLLRKLPGVTIHNYLPLLHACKSLAGLADMTVEELVPHMGSERNARMLRDFLDAKCPQLVTD